MPQNGYKKISNFEEITFYICENSSYVNYLKNTPPRKSPQKPKPRNPTQVTRMKTKAHKMIPQQTHHTNTKMNTRKCAHHHGSRMETTIHMYTTHKWKQNVNSSDDEQKQSNHHNQQHIHQTTQYDGKKYAHMIDNTMETRKQQYT